MRREHPDVSLVELPENIGVAARDHGLRRARGRFTMFLDSDAALTAGALPAMVEALDADAAWGLIGPRLVYDDGSLQLSSRRYPTAAASRPAPAAAGSFLRARTNDPPSPDGGHDHTRTRPVLYVLGACQLFRSSLARAAGPFDDSIFLGWDDADWCIRIRDAGGEVVYFPEATVIHSYRRSDRRQPVSRASLKMLQAHARFQLKYLRRRRELIRLGEQLDA